MRRNKKIVGSFGYVKYRFISLISLGGITVLSACTTQSCDPTGAMTASCAPMKMHVWTGEAFEEDKMFYYRKGRQSAEDVRDIAPTQLSKQVLKGQKDYDIIWSRDGSAKKAVFYKRPASF